MNVTARETTAAQQAAPARPAAAATPALAATPAATAQAVLATTARAASSDPLAALLQGANDPPDLQLPASNLARRYAETGVLSQSANRANPAAPASNGQANAAQTAAPAAAAQSANTAQAPAAQAAQANASVVIDGRMIALNPIQAIAVRAAIGSSIRHIGAGTGASDSEDPTAVTPQSVLEATKTAGQKVTALSGSPDSTTGDQHHTNPIPFVRRQVDQGTEIEEVHEVRAARPAPYEPAPIPDKPATNTHATMPVAPDVAVFAPKVEQEHSTGPKAFTGMAIAFAPGVTPDQVAAETYKEGYKITVQGHDDYFFIGAKDALNAQLVFANGSTLRIALLPASRQSPASTSA